MSPYLLLDGPAGQTRFGLEKSPTILGRAAECGVRIDDRSLSNQHCRLEQVPGGWKVVDLESRNGTFVNDVLVAQRRLEDGDTLRVGRLAFRYFVENGGPTGANSDYIGIDTFQFNDTGPCGGVTPTPGTPSPTATGTPCAGTVLNDAYNFFAIFAKSRKTL